MVLLYYDIFHAFSTFFPKLVLPLVSLPHTFLLSLSWQNILEVPLFLSNHHTQLSSSAPGALPCRDPNPWRCFPNAAGSDSGSFPSLAAMPLPSPALSHSVSSVTRALCTVTELCWEAPPATGSWGTAEHPFAAGSAPLSSGSLLVNLQGVWAKSTNQAPLSKLDSRRGNSLIDYIKKKRKFPERRQNKTCWGRRQLQPPAPYANSHRWRVGGRDAKPSPAGTYSLCLNEGDTGAKIFQGKGFCRCKLTCQ